MKKLKILKQKRSLSINYFPKSTMWNLGSNEVNDNTTIHFDRVMISLGKFYSLYVKPACSYTHKELYSCKQVLLKLTGQLTGVKLLPCPNVCILVSMLKISTMKWVYLGFSGYHFNTQGNVSGYLKSSLGKVSFQGFPVIWIPDYFRLWVILI